MRVIKEADKRKNEILNAAAILFADKGFDNTSVADIMEAVGIAKGTLYHHFKSKEDIMDALIERQTSTLLSAAVRTSEDMSLPVIERLIHTILALHVGPEQIEGEEMVRQLHKPQNALMHQKIRQVLLKRVPPILVNILEDGIAQGLFETPYPLECMEMSLCYLDILLDEDVFELSEEQRSCKIQAFIFQLERLLGVKPGGLACLAKAFQGGQEKYE